jgi:hypothetical protein
MKLREKRRILIFLELLAERFQQDNKQNITQNLVKYFTREDLNDLVFWLFPKAWTIDDLSFKTDEELLDLIGNDLNILLYLIDKLEQSIIAYPKLKQEEVDAFFQRTQNEIHYLASKPVEEWDSYDKSNYRSLLLKTGTTKKVYGIFTSDVLAEDVYAVTTKPSYFFDTEEEAEAEIESIVSEGQFSKEELVVHKLWLLQ